MSSRTSDARHRIAHARPDLAAGEALDRVEQTIDAAAGTHLTISPSQHAAILLAKAAAPSPANVPAVVVERCRDRLTPEQTIELMTWLPILSTLHRRQVFDDCRRETI